MFQVRIVEAKLPLTAKHDKTPTKIMKENIKRRTATEPYAEVRVR